MPSPIVEQPQGADGQFRKPSEFPWPPVLFFAALAASWGLNYAWPLPWPGIDDVPAHLIGWGFLIAGFGIAGWALRTMLAARAEIRPHAEATVLVTSGPFRRFRNPMYLGYALVLLGLAEASHNIWIAAMTPVFALAVTWLA